MSETLVFSEKASKLSFLCKKISTHESNMSYWLKVPEFVDRAYALYVAEQDLNDRVVLEFMKEIYKSKEEAQVPNAEFNYRWARRAIYQIEKACNP